MSFRTPYRKSPQREIKLERFASNIVTQRELAHVAKLQSEVWLMAEEARAYAQEIDHRLRSGAAVTRGELVFDRRFQIVVRKSDQTSV